MGNRHSLYNGSCLDVLPTLAEGSADLVLTDPPYGTTALAFDRDPIDWAAWWKEVDRVCTPSAVVLCFSAQPFTTDLVNSNRRYFRYDLVWQKKMAVGYLSASVRPLRSHEHILVFCRRFGRAGGRLQSIYNPQFEAGTPYHHSARKFHARHYGGAKSDASYDNAGSRYPRSVLTYGKDFPSLHPCAKPVALLRWLVRTYSHPGCTVLDPFMGSGATGMACALEDRGFVGIELDPDFYRLAARRIRENRADEP